MHDLAAAARFRRTLVAGGGFARGAEGRVPLCLSHDVSCLPQDPFNQK